MSINRDPQTNNDKTKLVVMISGSGTNLQAIIDRIEDGTIANTIIAAVISNRPEVAGLKRAERHNIPTYLIDHKRYADRNTYDQALAELIQTIDPDYIILAGYMRILTPHMIDPFSDRIINIHPSLLPKHKGLNTHESVLTQSDEHHGCSVHFVTESLDSGPIIAQASFEVSSVLKNLDLDRTESPNSVSKRELEFDNKLLMGSQTEALRVQVQKLEHLLYPLCIRWLVQRRLSWNRDTNKLYLDDKVLADNGRRFTLTQAQSELCQS